MSIPGKPPNVAIEGFFYWFGTFGEETGLPLYLLATNVNVDVDKLSILHLLIIVISVIVLATIVLLCGFYFRTGDKEINIGGVQRLLAKRDKDMLLKEELKKFSDDVDHEVTADLYDLVEELEDHLREPLTQGDHCYFTYDKFASIIKSELYRRIRRNSLWEKLTEAGKDRYVNTILKSIEDRYVLLRAKVSQVKCKDTYADFASVKGAIREVLIQFFDRTAVILISGMEKKCEKYEKTKGDFQTVAAKKLCCDDCIEKNRARIDKLKKAIS